MHFSFTYAGKDQSRVDKTPSQRSRGGKSMPAVPIQGRAQAIPQKKEAVQELRSDPGAAIGRFVVQRAVGFEYELDGSFVSSKVTKEKKKTLGLFGDDEPSKPIVDLEKGYVIADYDRFDVSVDSTPVGFDVEIRIKEVDHISPATLTDLQATVYQVLSILEILSTATHPVSGDTIGGDPNVLMYGDFSSGSVQATAGLSLTALHAFLSGEMGVVHENRQHKSIRTKGLDHPDTEEQSVKAFNLRQYGKGGTVLLQKAQYYVNILFPYLTKGAKEQVAAVITSILTIPITARDNQLPYAKSATTFLARSDYATVFNELPAAVLMNKERLKFLIMVILNSYLPTINARQVGLESQVYPRGSIKDSQGLSLTIGEWLDGLLPASGTVGGTQAPKDYLSDTNYPKGKYSNDDFSQLESLGGYGSKTDAGEGGKRLPIFEFRKYLSIRPRDLLPVISGIWELVHLANKKK
ncbi:hypothetical protein Q4E93_15890 [Flavitalea sp. BT771]|uniref:hypothetical protein n=1 Tax=Flavitalea sp. BT771 TaxID=3063329 RepID=UPI0026E39121|nr:hypothetical protein [Flavitalea sp. BT771]MDO6432084.1 hypothetical protein [Flavitalea sp. BT771]MDV6220993.1 hypothetical protein [Flavitalea sp. BT771]